jgi:uncharacterized protein (DUF1697 family)
MASAQQTIALIRGINVGGHKKVAMADLRRICEAQGCTNVRTLLNSGNVVFEGRKPDAKKLEAAIGAKVILRTPAELDRVIARVPFATDDPGHLLVMFLEHEPKAPLDWPGPEKVHLDGRHLYLYYPDGAGRSKLTNALIEKRLDVSGTARNWNTVTKLAALCETERSLR